MSSSINLSTNIKTQLRHELRLNAQTKLWLDTISMPAIELKEKIEKEMEENPFLEYDFKYSYILGGLALARQARGSQYLVWYRHVVMDGRCL